jgi:hypothetical protein
MFITSDVIVTPIFSVMFPLRLWELLLWAFQAIKLIMVGDHGLTDHVRDKCPKAAVQFSFCT